MTEPIEFLSLPVASSVLPSDTLPLVRGESSYQVRIETLLNASKGYAVARETKADGENGGIFPFGTWYTRPLNEHRGLGELVGNGVKLPAGKYVYFGFGLAMQVRAHQTRLLKTGGFSEPGLSAYSPYALATLSALGPWEVDVDGNHILYLQHRCGRDYPRDWGLGYRAGFGAKEVYSGILFLKVS